MTPFGRLLLLGFAAAAPAAGSAVMEPPQEPPASRQTITPALERVLHYLDQAMPVRIVDRRSGAEVALQSAPIQEAILDLGEAGAFDPLAYETGVIHDGMLAAAEATGDPAFREFTAKRLSFLREAEPYFRAQALRWGMEHNTLRPLFAPAALDDCGAMAAALIDAQEARVGPPLDSEIRRWTDYIAREQFRLSDGAMARHRPQPVTVWADDMYMSIPALAGMGRLTGEPAWFDDAARVARAMSARLFRPEAGLFAHGWYADNPQSPDVFWGRANGWALLALERLLDQLPSGHPQRGAILERVQRQLQALSRLQSASGLWHQLLDRDDSYLETSCSAMFVYGLAHAINRGWISPVAYGCVAEDGWRGLVGQINARGQVENTCVGTTLGSATPYYYARPTSPYATHAYGPVLLAGAEMIRLAENRSFEIVNKNGAYHFVPLAPQADPPSRSASQH